ncbi:MAG: 16S rRNA (uracil1498-N3)-methyltransferase [Bermanella sp.]|jgi:16S rRNA (uracil1498-N3)-methyltransferase
MRVPRIYYADAYVANTSIKLDETASRHLCQVLRLSAGHPLTVFNGQGQAFAAEIELADRKRALVRVGAEKASDPQPPLAIHLGIALSKGDRFDWVVQKATELGVSHITPLQTQRVDVRLNRERAEKKLRHWQQIIISACEQCGRNTLSALSEITALDQWLAISADEKWVLCPDNAQALATEHRPTSVALLIGPEGGLDEMEIAHAQKSGFKALQLGPRVLRTETAPLAAIAILQHHWGDM